MDRTERFYKIDQMIHDRKLVPFVDLMAALEVSRATLKRDLEYMRNRLNAPIVWDREAGGYRFDTPHAEAGAQYELPGLWFNSGEVHALLTMQHLLTDLDPGGILTPHIRPLIARLNSLLGTAENPAEEIRRRVLIVGLGKRELKLALLVSQCLLLLELLLPSEPVLFACGQPSAGIGRQLIAQSRQGLGQRNQMLLLLLL